MFPNFQNEINKERKSSKEEKIGGTKKKFYCDDFTKFSPSKKNRAINRNNVNNIKNSMATFGYNDSFPITVNKENEIISGHHRFIAAQELNIGFYYELKEISLAEVILNEIAQRNWTTLDCIKFWSDNENPNQMHYQFALNLIEKFNITTSVCLDLCANGRKGSNTLYIFKTGQLTIKNYEFIHNCINNVEEIVATIQENGIKNSYKFKNSHGFRALLKLLNHKQFDPKMLIHSINENASLVQAGTSEETYLNNLLYVYNYRRQAKNKINKSDFKRYIKTKTM